MAGKRGPAKRKARPGTRARLRTGVRKGPAAKRKPLRRKGVVRRRARAPVSQQHAAYWAGRAYTAGCAAATAAANHRSVEAPGESEHARVNEAWATWCQAAGKPPWTLYSAAAARFMEGWRSMAGGYDQRWVLVPTTKTIGVVITVMNEQETVGAIIAELQRLPLHEMIFVVNGSTDASFERIRNQSSSIIVHYDEPLGHDVGRAVGAKLADSDILLFLDGDLPVKAEQLVPFVAAISEGSDVALNDISPLLGLFAVRDKVTVVKEFVNRAMGRADLAANSLTAVPHALSREALLRIGAPQLSVPPKAQVIAIEQGLKLVCPASVDVISGNRIRSQNTGGNNAVAQMIVGDHIEALQAAMQRRGARLGFPDQLRQRGYIMS
ncbi:glycosyltransferase family 2 protein [Paenibacillus daejeonensis]|uniref:glycosyltransferase family 2 protein n=1 Tax=Paenibacillus daejeonensis TaxID=135193 RepID=UPI00039F5718|nr:glycosyltransferase [Paenibacillus daejeonensis]